MNALSTMQTKLMSLAALKYPIEGITQEQVAVHIRARRAFCNLLVSAFNEAFPWSMDHKPTSDELYSAFHKLVDQFNPGASVPSCFWLPSHVGPSNGSLFGVSNMIDPGIVCGTLIIAIGVLSLSLLCSLCKVAWDRFTR